VLTRTLRSRWIAFLGFFLPGLLVYIVFFLIPAVQGFLFSFQSWQGFRSEGFIGWDNYVRMFDDEILIGSLENVVYFMVINTVFPIALGLFVVELLNRKGLRGVLWYRSLFFLPQVFTLTAVGILFRWIAHPDYGLINVGLSAVGLSEWRHAWLGDSDTAIHAVATMTVWLNYGYAMVILLAGVQKINPALYEAARMDGAGRWREFTAVTMPSLRNELTVVLVLMLIGALNTYPLIAAATAGGPGNATTVPALYGFRVFGYQGNLGYGAAIINALTVVTIIVTVAANQLRRKEGS
jgi:raffinose/stachyose/melibiose transport system permease protein